MSEHFLIQALFLWLYRHFKILANSKHNTSATIDRDLQFLERYEGYLQQPLSERPKELTNERLHEFIQTIKDISANRSSQKIEFRKTFDELENQYADLFPPSYWEEWLKRKVVEAENSPF